MNYANSLWLVRVDGSRSRILEIRCSNNQHQVPLIGSVFAALNIGQPNHIGLVWILILFEFARTNEHRCMWFLNKGRRVK